MNRIKTDTSGVELKDGYSCISISGCTRERDREVADLERERESEGECGGVAPVRVIVCASPVPASV